jgi:hypothetical protein
MNEKIVPMDLPRFLGPTVSIKRARPIVHTRPELIPCSTLAKTRSGTVVAANTRKVAKIKTARPRRKGACRVEIPKVNGTRVSKCLSQRGTLLPIYCLQ